MGNDMHLEFLLSGVAAMAILVYLVYALLRPERF
jgi:K+-transporting ATPase KdpF subunit